MKKTKTKQDNNKQRQQQHQAKQEAESLDATSLKLEQIDINDDADSRLKAVSQVDGQEKSSPSSESSSSSSSSSASYEDAFLRPESSQDSGLTTSSDHTEELEDEEDTTTIDQSKELLLLPIIVTSNLPNFHIPNPYQYLTSHQTLQQQQQYQLSTEPTSFNANNINNSANKPETATTPAPITQPQQQTTAENDNRQHQQSAETTQQQAPNVASGPALGSDQVAVDWFAWELIGTQSRQLIASGSHRVANNPNELVKAIELLMQEIAGRPFLPLTHGPLSLRQNLHPAAIRAQIELSSYFDRYIDLQNEYWWFMHNQHQNQYQSTQHNNNTLSTPNLQQQNPMLTSQQFCHQPPTSYSNYHLSNNNNNNNIINYQQTTDTKLMMMQNVNSALPMRQNLYPAAIRPQIELCSYFDRYIQMQNEYWWFMHHQHHQNQYQFTQHNNNTLSTPNLQQLNPMLTSQQFCQQLPTNYSNYHLSNNQQQQTADTRYMMMQNLNPVQHPSTQPNASLDTYCYPIVADQQQQQLPIAYETSPYYYTGSPIAPHQIVDENNGHGTSAYLMTGALNSVPHANQHHQQMQQTLSKIPMPPGIAHELFYMRLIVGAMLTSAHQLDLKSPRLEIISRKYNPIGPRYLTDHRMIPDSTVVRARGLPWQANEEDIAKFFLGLNVSSGGVGLCLSKQGRRNGEALIRFETALHRQLALARHKHYMGSRYIEIYRATGSDFLSVVRSENKPHSLLARNSKAIVRMRGLPFSCTAKQIVDFFSAPLNANDSSDLGFKTIHDSSKIHHQQQTKEPTGIMNNEEGVIFVRNQDSKPTGDAFVLFVSDIAAQRALQKHHQNIGDRYVELFRSTLGELQQVISMSSDQDQDIVSSHH